MFQMVLKCVRCTLDAIGSFIVELAIVFLFGWVHFVEHDIPPCPAIPITRSFICPKDHAHKWTLTLEPGYVSVDGG